MQQAIDAYRHVSATDEFRELERIRSKARHDEAQALYDAEKAAFITVAKNLLNIGDTIEKIISVTGLTREEVENLQ